jgi:hypothetical protein
VKIRTHLNTDDLTEVEVLVLGSESVEIHCDGTEITMGDEALALFIETGAGVLPRLRPRPFAKPAGTVRDVPRRIGGNQAGDVWVLRHPVSSTWVICAASDPLGCSALGDSVELNWGVLDWTMTGGALARLLGRARQAQTVLRERMDCARGDVPDHVIGDGGVRSV